MAETPNIKITDEMVTRAAASVHEWGLSDVPVWLERAIARAALEAALHVRAAAIAADQESGDPS